MDQLSLFDDLPKQPTKNNSVPSLDRFEGALLYSSVGDALGWPTEFLRPNGHHQLPFDLPIGNFVEWKKVVGGKWWGYEQKIAPGEYSDDTQLTLAVARCIAETGQFEPERFAYEELPLWLQYERGGGKSIKTAARKLIGKNADWLQNFYKQGDLEYKNAGANGAAMRNLPIILVSVPDEGQMIKDSFLNAIITHGHPRAILGAILFGLAVNYVLTSSRRITAKEFVESLYEGMKQIPRAIDREERIKTWIQKWDKHGHQRLSFKQAYSETLQEAASYLKNISELLNSDTKSFYNLVGALTPTTKGSGLGTVCAAIYVFLKYIDEPEEALTVAVNMFGSDTDTIGVFLGALLGAYHGTNAIPSYLLEKVQDREYLFKTAKRLHSIACRTQSEILDENKAVGQKEAYFKILAWEIGLHEMFWDAINVGGTVFHPTLGRGEIVHKEVKPIKREGYVAKLIHVNFDCGQSCIFHSRVEHEEKVSESLAEDIVNALRD